MTGFCYDLGGYTVRINQLMLPTGVELQQNVFRGVCARGRARAHCTDQSLEQLEQLVSRGLALLSAAHDRLGTAVVQEGGQLVPAQQVQQLMLHTGI